MSTRDELLDVLRDALRAPATENLEHELRQLREDFAEQETALRQLELDTARNNVS